MFQADIHSLFIPRLVFAWRRKRAINQFTDTKMDKKRKIIIIMLSIFFISSAISIFFILNGKGKKVQPEKTRADILKQDFENFIQETMETPDRRMAGTGEQADWDNLVMPKNFSLESVDDCNLIKNDAPLKQKCLAVINFKKIVGIGDIKNCETLDKDWKDLCIFEIFEARRLPDDNCMLISNASMRNNCFEHHAIYLHEKDFCAKMTEGQNECEDRVVVQANDKKGDINNCKSIETLEYLWRCIGSNDNPCEDFKDENWISMCYVARFFHSVIFKGEKKDCAILPISNYRKVCELYFDNNHTHPDSDGDGFDNYVEIVGFGTNPFDKDATPQDYYDREKRAGEAADNIKGRILKELASRGLLIDSDSDGLRDYEEKEIYKTDIENVDTDKDGYSDGDEVNKYFTKPLLKDSAPKAATTFVK